MSASPVESRLAALISAYADRAPVDVDPIAMARNAAATSRHGPRLVVSGLANRELAFVVLMLALVTAAVAGALVAGADLFRRDVDELLTGRELVDPFVGLPPEGAPPSSPKTGELTLAFDARIPAIGMDVHSMRVYTDGRLIWHRNLEDSNPAASRSAFGARTPTTAVIEQLLTAKGVEMLRSEVMRTATVIGPVQGSDYVRLHPGGGSGVYWGGIAVRLGGQLRAVDWSDAALPGRLANPGAWLPADGWADRRIGAFVPARYAVCLWHDPSESFASTTFRLPAAVKPHLANAPVVIGATIEPPTCYAVSTDVVRNIVTSLDEEGLERLNGLMYRIPDVTGPGRTFVGIDPIVPSGEVYCTDCG